jgi:capsular exopolysaccharide synthesis family protein
VLAVLVVVFSILQIITPIYRSNVTLLIESEKSNVVKVDEVYGVSSSREYFNTQAEIIKSRGVALKTILSLKLWDAPEFKKVDKKSTLSSLLSLFGLSPSQIGFTEEQKLKPTEIDLADSIVGKFSGALKVESIKNSKLIIISFESEDPVLAQKVANAIASIYINNDRDSKLKMTQDVNSWLQSKLEGLRDKLLASESALQTYREKQGIVDVNGSVQTLAAQQIGDVTQRLVEAHVKRAELQSAYDQIVKIKDGDYSSVPAVIKSPVVSEARSKEAIASSKLSELSQRYGNEHTKMIAAEAEYKSAQENTKIQMSIVTNGLTREFEVARSTERALEDVLAGAKGSLQTVNRSGTQLGVFERDVSTNKQLYEMFLARAKETTSTGSFQSSVARIIDDATVGKKVKPNKPLILLIVLLLSISIGVAAAVYMESLDNTIKGAEDAETRLGYPVLASIPLIEEKERKNVSQLISTQPDSLFAESFRTASTGVSLSNLDGDKKVILITSSVAGEGKTSVSSNLSLALAGSKRVLLIDADMRRPKVAESFGLKGHQFGLSNLMIGQGNAKQCIHQIPNTKLSVMPVGLIPPNPLDLISSNRFKEMIDSLSAQFDFIVIDSPPIELVSDALALSSMVDSVIYVIKAMDTPAPLVIKALTRLERNNCHVLGFILNQLDFKASHKYYGEYSPYSKYGYTGYGYDAEKSDEKQA